MVYGRLSKKELSLLRQQGRSWALLWQLNIGQLKALAKTNYMLIENYDNRKKPPQKKDYVITMSRVVDSSLLAQEVKQIMKG